MEKDKMIQEMVNDLEHCGVNDGCDFCVKKNYPCHIYDWCKTLVEKGYRKVPEGSVVLTKREYAKYKEHWHKEYREGFDFAEKKTAREILKLIKPKCEICDKKMHEGCMCMQEQAEKAIKKAYSIVDEVKEEIEDEDLPQKALFPNPCTKEKEAFETIIFQNRDNGYISDAYRNDIDVVCKGLNILHALQNKLENNTLYRVFPFETAKAFLAMIDPGCEECDGQQHEGCYCLIEKIKAKLKKYMEGI